ncbi:uncharacterized protein Triagg1_10879 [Trichoderma aggressivum f. europaeum]|uniref:Uncharacterized protein n=1 Tax=Trichoderma aggressivum f. europaeum TaxID=173218 RepID=A0AAE1IZE7_9HYPO|nr:hypothetical protein Triagg1_10879 [Trichoderma aggressivum f. europaeum]
MTPSSPVLGAANIARWILRSQALQTMGHLKSAPTGYPNPSRTTKRELREDSAEPIDLERDRAVGTKPSAPKKQRTSNGPSGIAIQPDSVDGENGAAAGFCLMCVKRMSQGIFDGENLSLKKPVDGPALCPACVNKMPWKSLIEAYVKSSKATWEEHIILGLGSPDAPVSDKVCVDLGTEEGREVGVWAIGAESQDLRASASKARKAAIDFATQCVRWHNATADLRAAASVFAELQGSYADYVTRFKSACLANDQLLHDKTMREAATHFRSVKMAQMSRDRCQALLNEISMALRTLIRPAIP